MSKTGACLPVREGRGVPGPGGQEEAGAQERRRRRPGARLAGRPRLPGRRHRPRAV